MPAASILRAASDAPSDSRAARIWKFSSTGPSSGSTTVNPRWVSPMTRPSDSSLRSASRTGVWLTWNRCGQVPLPQLLARGQLAGDDQLAG